MSQFLYGNKKELVPTATLSKTTSFKGVLHFDGLICIMGRFNGTIEAKGDLIVGKGAQVDCDHIYVNSITVHGMVTSQINANDKVDLMSGSEVHGDIRAGRLRIADGVLFEGRCSMINEGSEAEIFSMSTPEIKAALRPDVYGAQVDRHDTAEQPEPADPATKPAMENKPASETQFVQADESAPL
ncbi:MAG: polymer-forming cytoskeletal protein [Spirochaetaceae bacterium]|jgi:cytoskeletal protein CcmA (bactofilin family)|nr:polymer-forming cytoskeletal protein [Spirochaetaceae bacterium]